MSLNFTDWASVPGQQAARLTSEQSFLWSRGAFAVFTNGVVIDGTARDNGNTPTTELRPGLLMGMITASNTYKQWDPTAVDGSESFAGILSYKVKMIDSNGANVNRIAPLVIGGCVQNAGLFTNASPFTLTNLARNAMGPGFFFDDDYGRLNTQLGWRGVLLKAASYILTAQDSGLIVVQSGSSGAVTFTLPAQADGMRFKFLNQDNQNMAVTGAVANTLVVSDGTTGTATGSTATFQTASQKIGSALEVVAANGKWFVLVETKNTVTVS